MATTADWVEGARIRTLPTAVAPVLAGSALAWHADAFAPLPAALALVVALALQIGVNYANDYSDGIRGTDADRIGPMRLVGSGAASPRAVKTAAFASFGAAALAGVVLVVLTAQWWLLAVGVGAADAVGVVVGVVDADLQRECHDQRERRACGGEGVRVPGDRAAGEHGGDRRRQRAHPCTLHPIGERRHDAPPFSLRVASTTDLAHPRTPGAE